MWLQARTVRDYMGYRKVLPGGTTAFDLIDCSNNPSECTSSTQFPKLDWIRVSVRTDTTKGEDPELIEQSYNNWTDWQTLVQRVCLSCPCALSRRAPAVTCWLAPRHRGRPCGWLMQTLDPMLPCLQSFDYQGMFVASKDWVTAVTYVQIANSTYGTVFLSIGLASAVVFVFCGPLMMVFAAITLLMINVTVMGVLYTWGWCAAAVCCCTVAMQHVLACLAEPSPRWDARRRAVAQGGTRHPRATLHACWRAWRSVCAGRYAPLQ
jgi:hypothetical protein